MESTGYALALLWPMMLAMGISMVMYVLPIVALIYFIRYVMGIKRLAAIAEENLVLNRQRTAHLEKIAAVLVSMKKSAGQSDLPL